MTEIYYQKNGQGDAVVLLHSGGMSHQEWQPQIKPLSEHFTVYTPDTPGHGQSLYDGPIRIRAIAEALIEWMDTLGLERVHLVGSSLGGALALYLAIHHPSRINKLVLYRISYSKDENSYQETLKMANPDYWRQYGMDKWLSKQHLAQGGSDAWQTVIANVSKLLNPVDSDHAHQLSDLKNITADTLVITGDRDPLIPIQTAVDMVHALPRAALWVIPNASHVTATNTWRAPCFSEELIRFLTKK